MTVLGLTLNDVNPFANGSNLLIFVMFAAAVVLAIWAIRWRRHQEQDYDDQHDRQPELTRR